MSELPHVCPQTRGALTPYITDSDPKPLTPEYPKFQPQTAKGAPLTLPPTPQTLSPNLVSGDFKVGERLGEGGLIQLFHPWGDRARCARSGGSTLCPQTRGRPDNLEIKSLIT